jgi:hypothetical protein
LLSCRGPPKKKAKKTKTAESLKDCYGKPERESEWEPIKIILEGDRGSNKMNTASNTRLRLNYPS